VGQPQPSRLGLLSSSLHHDFNRVPQANNLSGLRTYMNSGQGSIRGRELI